MHRSAQRVFALALGISATFLPPKGDGASDYAIKLFIILTCNCSARTAGEWQANRLLDAGPPELKTLEPPGAAIPERGALKNVSEWIEVFGS